MVKLSFCVSSYYELYHFNAELAFMEPVLRMPAKIIGRVKEANKKWNWFEPGGL